MPAAARRPVAPSEAGAHPQTLEGGGKGGGGGEGTRVVDVASTTSASGARTRTWVGGEEEGREETVHTNSHRPLPWDCLRSSYLAAHTFYTNPHLPLLWDRLHSSHLAAQAVDVLAEGEEAAATSSQLVAHRCGADGPAGHDHIPEGGMGRGGGRGSDGSLLGPKGTSWGQQGAEGSGGWGSSGMVRRKGRGEVAQ